MSNKVFKQLDVHNCTWQRCRLQNTSNRSQLGNDSELNTRSYPTGYSSVQLDTRNVCTNSVHLITSVLQLHRYCSWKYIYCLVLQKRNIYLWSLSVYRSTRLTYVYYYHNTHVVYVSLYKLEHFMHVWQFRNVHLLSPSMYFWNFYLKGSFNWWSKLDQITK